MQKEPTLQDIFEIVTFVKDNAITKDELQEVRMELKAEIQELRTELKAEIQEVRVELKAEIQKVRMELQAVHAELKKEIQELRIELKAEIQKVRAELNTNVENFFDLYQTQAGKHAELRARFRLLEKNQSSISRK